VVEFHEPLSLDEETDRKALAAAAETRVRRGQARALAGAAVEQSAPISAQQEIVAVAA
jgi:hypothetical protein